MDVKNNILFFQREAAESGGRLIAVTKTQPVEKLREAYDAGQRIFGENKVQELTSKYEQLPRDIEWHMIGHLQSNKVKYMAPFVALIHSVDSLKLLAEIDRQGNKGNRVISCLLQVHIASEETKFGFSETELRTAAEAGEFSAFQFVRIEGLMGMASNTPDLEKVRSEFRGLKNLFDSLKQRTGANWEMKELSMGMSADYKIALEEGSTLVRVGSAIFGGRDYSKSNS